ncbi:MAG: transcriptional regulator, TetR family, partial [Solirubrobacterales bacterium]|nr:transcriptional regulator, TetR family [Solirubrobacterales bacterium]
MEQTLEVAHRLFAERGYAEVTMDEIAAAVGVTKPLLYNYFGNKDRLYLACVGRTGDALVAAIRAAQEQADGPGEALKASLRAYFTYLDAERGAWQVLYDETLPSGGQIAEAVGRYRDELTAVVATAVRGLSGARRRGPRAQAEAEALAHLLLSAA